MVRIRTDLEFLGVQMLRRSDVLGVQMLRSIVCRLAGGVGIIFSMGGIKVFLKCSPPPALQLPTHLMTC